MAMYRCAHGTHTPTHDLPAGRGGIWMVPNPLIPSRISAIFVTLLACCARHHQKWGDVWCLEPINTTVQWRRPWGERTLRMFFVEVFGLWQGEWKYSDVYLTCHFGTFHQREENTDKEIRKWSGQLAAKKVQKMVNWAWAGTHAKSGKKPRGVT
jgi:hypothetical protein